MIAFASARAPSSRLPHGRRGLKYMDFYRVGTESSRLPHGRRGLKYEANTNSAGHGNVAFLTEGGD